jgi:hypothetical protein
MDQRAFYLAKKSYQRAVQLAKYRENDARIEAGLPPLPIDEPAKIAPPGTADAGYQALNSAALAVEVHSPAMIEHEKKVMRKAGFNPDEIEDEGNALYDEERAEEEEAHTVRRSPSEPARSSSSVSPAHYGARGRPSALSSPPVRDPSREYASAPSSAAPSLPSHGRNDSLADDPYPSDHEHTHHEYQD